jgi:hypothetical protein
MPHRHFLGGPREDAGYIPNTIMPLHEVKKRKREYHF